MIRCINIILKRGQIWILQTLYRYDLVTQSGKSFIRWLRLIYRLEDVNEKERAVERNEPSEESIRDAILTDLQAVRQSNLERHIKGDKLIQKWMTINGIKDADLIKS